jgi:hypothetical protein
MKYQKSYVKPNKCDSLNTMEEKEANWKINAILRGDNTSTRCVRTQKNAVLIYFVAET